MATPRAEKRKSQDVVSPTGLTPELKTNKGECTIDNFDKLKLSPSRRFCVDVFKYGSCPNEPKELDSNGFNKLDLLELVVKTNSLIENQQNENTELLGTFELKDPRPSREYANKPDRLEKAKFLPDWISNPIQDTNEIIENTSKQIINRVNNSVFTSAPEEEMETKGPTVDALLASDQPDEPMDLTDKQMAILEVKCEEAKGDKPLDAKKGKYGPAAGKPEKPKVYGVLYILTCLKERAPITEEDFKAFMNIADAKIMEAVWSGQWDPAKNIRFPWNIWVKNSGIIGCLNEASMDYMVELTKTITLPGKTFKAWKKGEYGFSILVTLILPPGSKAIKREVIVPLILKQNGLVDKILP